MTGRLRRLKTHDRTPTVATNPSRVMRDRVRVHRRTDLCSPIADESLPKSLESTACSKALKARVVRWHPRARCAGHLAERLPHRVDAPHARRCLGSAIPRCPRGRERQCVRICFAVARLGPIEDGGPAVRRRLRSCVRKRTRRDGIGVGALANGGPEGDHQGDPAAARVSGGHAAATGDLPSSPRSVRVRRGGGAQRGGRGVWCLCLCGGVEAHHAMQVLAIEHQQPVGVGQCRPATLRQA